MSKALQICDQEVFYVEKYARYDLLDPILEVGTSMCHSSSLLAGLIFCVQRSQPN
jgi:hypothetical protein